MSENEKPKKSSHQVGVRLANWEYEEIKAMAKEKHRSMSSQVAFIVRHHLEVIR